MVFSVSPAVRFREVDLTGNIPAVSSTEGAIAGVFGWGPINEPVLVTSEADLVSYFGRPTNDNYETWFTAANFLAYSNKLYTVRIDNDANTATNSVSFNAKYPGAIGNSIEVSIVTGTSNYEEVLFNAGEATEEDPLASIFNTNTFVFNANTNVTASGTGDLIPGDILQVGNDEVGYQNLFVASVAVAGDSAPFTHIVTFHNNYLLAEESITNLKMTRFWGYSYITDRAPDANCAHIVIVDKTGMISGDANLAGTVLEKYENVAINDNVVQATTYDGSNNYFKDIIENRSMLISNIAGSADLTANVRQYSRLSGGTDGDSETAVATGKVQLGYDLFKNSDDMDIAFILQGKAKGGTNLANYIVGNICEVRKDCVAMLSPPKETIISGNAPISDRNALRNGIISYRNALQASSYWFMDTGYKYRYDKYNDKYRWVPLNGDIGGLAARVDPWESMAGYKRGVIKNVYKLAYNPNKDERDILYGRDINPVINVQGQGTLLFGDKTGLGRSSAFDRINVRRLFIVVEKAIATVSATMLFDINNDFTQNEFRNLVDPFLRDIKGRGGITDFVVVCDSRINTPDVIDRNEFKANIFIKPARSINFIDLTFVATRSGISFEEVIGQQF